MIKQINASVNKSSYCKTSYRDVHRYLEIIRSNKREYSEQLKIGPVVCLGVRNGREVDLFRVALLSGWMRRQLVHCLEQKWPGFNPRIPLVESVGRSEYRNLSDKSCVGVEINPLVLDGQGNFVLLDAKVILDDIALFRHPELKNLKDISEENPLEYEASQNDMNYVKLDGSIGCMVNGAGLAMATMDIIKQFEEEPANFLDLGGTANKERAIKGFKIIQSDTNVRSVLINIFGGIIRCDMIASGIVEAIKELNFTLPIVVRFQGTNAAQGRDIINQSSSDVISIDDLTEAAKKAVELAQ